MLSRAAALRSLRLHLDLPIMADMQTTEDMDASWDELKASATIIARCFDPFLDSLEMLQWDVYDGCCEWLCFPADPECCDRLSARYELPERVRKQA